MSLYWSRHEIFCQRVYVRILALSDGHGKTWEMGDLHIEDEKISAAKKGIFERASNDSLRRDKNQLFLYFSADVRYYHE